MCQAQWWLAIISCLNNLCSPLGGRDVIFINEKLSLAKYIWVSVLILLVVWLILFHSMKMNLTDCLVHDKCWTAIFLQSGKNHFMETFWLLLLHSNSRKMASLGQCSWRETHVWSSPAKITDEINHWIT